MTSDEELDKIINTHTWIKVSGYTRHSADYQREHDMLIIHHRKETEFLIAKCRQLAQELKDERNEIYRR